MFISSSLFLKYVSTQLAYIFILPALPFLTPAFLSMTFVLRRLLGDLSSPSFCSTTLRGSVLLLSRYMMMMMMGGGGLNCQHFSLKQLYSIFALLCCLLIPPPHFIRTTFLHHRLLRDSRSLRSCY